MASADLTFEVDLSGVREQLEQLPKDQKKAGLAMLAELERTAKRAERKMARAATKSEKDWKRAAGNMRSSILSVIPGFDALESKSRDLATLIGPKGMLVGGAVGLAAGLVGVAERTSQLAQEQDNLATRLGVSRDSAAAFQAQAALAGKDMGAFTSSLDSLREKLATAATGSVEGTRLFAALGVEIKNADGSMRGFEDVTVDVIDSLEVMRGTTEGAMMTSKLLGNEGNQLVDAFGPGGAASALHEATTQARQMGLVFDNEAIAAASDFQASTRKLTLAWQGFINTMGTYALPAINFVADALAGFDDGVRFLEAGIIAATDSEREWIETFQELQKEAGAGVSGLETLEGAHDSAAGAAERQRLALQRVATELRATKKAAEDTAEDIEFKPAAELTTIKNAAQEIAANYTTVADAAIEVQNKLGANAEAKTQMVFSSITDGVGQAGEGFGALASIASQSYQAIIASGEKMTEQQKRAAMDAFMIQQASSAAQVALSTAQAIMAAAAVPGGPLSPQGIAGMAIAAATGAAQAAAIAATPAPTFHTGGMFRQAPDETNAKLIRGEGVLTRQAVRNLGGEQGLRAMNRGESPGGQTLVVQQTYQHRAFGAFVADNVKLTDSPLRRAMSKQRRPGHFDGRR